MSVDCILIGIGNTFRSDDGVGIIIARRLHTMVPEGIEVMQASGEGTELINAWEDYRRVYLFDAVMNQGEPGKIYRLEASQKHFPSDFFKYSSHAFSLAEAVELARTLDRLPESLVVFGIEGENFSHGEQLSIAVNNAVDTVVKSVCDELKVAGGSHPETKY